MIDEGSLSMQELGHGMPWDPPPRRWRGLLAGCAFAVLLHMLALGGLRSAWHGTDPAPQLPRAVELPRWTAPQPALPPAVTPLAVIDPPAPHPLPEPAPLPVPAQAKATATSRATPPVLPVSVPAPVRSLPYSAELPTTTAAGDAAVPTRDDDDTIPSYRTSIPPAATLHYDARRGLARGAGDLHWRPSPEGYELTLAIAGGDGPAWLAQVSHGDFDAAGLAPSRFTDKRLRRPMSAANFQRAAGKITFSGPSTVHPLRDGSQDRLSWLVQLSAIVAAEPMLRETGARVVMNVVGAHGDAAVWVFVCGGSEEGGELLSYRREPRGPYDTAAAVVLDPAQSYLPSRVSLRSGSGDADGLELVLQDGALPP